MDEDCIFFLMGWVGEKQGLLLVFLRGPREFVVQERGKSLVILWWNCGGLWTQNDALLTFENFPYFKYLFFVRPCSFR
jgi:hypothetical protein